MNGGFVVYLCIMALYHMCVAIVASKSFNEVTFPEQTFIAFGSL
jgi:hypothetical protein